MKGESKIVAFYNKNGKSIPIVTATMVNTRNETRWNLIGTDGTHYGNVKNRNVKFPNRLTYGIDL